MINKENQSNSFNKVNWVQLSRCENVGPKTFIDLIKFHKTPEKAIEMIPEMVTKAGSKRKIKIAPKQQIEEEFEKSEKFGARILCSFEQAYPDSLKKISDHPSVITVKGNQRFLDNNERIAIVGARNSSINGCKLAGKLAENLSGKSYTIVSGLAKGIDASAHCASINNGTIGVIAAGIDNIYPAENKKLYEEIFENGVVVTEMPFGMKPISSNFPKRNRIISGLSLGVIVIEAALKSGTLITAQYARKQGRIVFAVPGSPLDIRHKGTNKLLKEGAIIVEDYLDVIRALEVGSKNQMNDNKDNFLHNEMKTPSENEVSKYREKVCSLLSSEPTDIQDIIEHADIDVATLNYILLELELAGRISRVYGNKVQMLF